MGPAMVWARVIEMAWPTMHKIRLGMVWVKALEIAQPTTYEIPPLVHPWTLPAMKVWMMRVMNETR